MLPTAAHGLAGARCRWCQQPLSVLQRLRGQHCDAAECRSRQARSEVLSARDAALARITGPASPPPERVLWLRPHHDDGHDDERVLALAPVPAGRRRALRAHLRAVAQAPQAHPRAAELQGYADEDPAPDALAQRVCGFCQGHCCRPGLGRRAFIDGPLLQRQAQASGQALAEVARDYARRIPAQHVQGSCLYHGAQGCVLPREMRAPVCNGFACDRLRQGQAWRAAQPGAALLLAVARGAQVLRTQAVPPNADG